LLLLRIIVLRRLGGRFDLLWIFWGLRHL
jgi:hypothetical protein